MNNDSVVKIFSKVKFFAKIKIASEEVSTNPIYNLQRSITFVEEGGSEIIFTINTVNVPDGTSVPYTITGVSSSEVVSGSLTGNFVINNNTSTVAVGLTLEPTSAGAASALFALDNGADSISVFPVPTYSLSRSAASVDEGSSVTFTLTTTNVSNGTVVPYSINGVSAEDFISESLTGNFIVNNGIATMTLTAFSDNTSEGPETMVVTLDGITPTVSAALVINDTSTTPVPTYTPYFVCDGNPITELNEGSGTAVFVVDTINPVLPISYTITGISQEDIDIPLTGVLYDSTGYSYFNFNLAADNLTEGSETMVVTLDGITPTVSAALVINDTSTTPVPTYNLVALDGNDSFLITEANEGGYVRWNLHTSNVEVGTEIPYTITGISQEDINIPLAGNFVIALNADGDIWFNIAQDFLTEGPETMVITLDGITPTVSAALVINDTSATPVPTYTAYFTDGSGAPITEVNEGGAGGNVLFRVNTTNVPGDTLIPYTITGISQEDTNLPLTGVLDWSSSEAGYFYLGNFDIFTDNLTEGPETMVVTLDGITPTVSAALVINDTSTTPVSTYNLRFQDGWGITQLSASETNSYQENYRMIVLETSNVPYGTLVPYTITGISQEDVDIPLTGNFIADEYSIYGIPGIAVLNLTITEDFLTEGTETMVVTLDGITPTISAALVINDTSTE